MSITSVACLPRRKSVNRSGPGFGYGFMVRLKHDPHGASLNVEPAAFLALQRTRAWARVHAHACRCTPCGPCTYACWRCVPGCMQVAFSVCLSTFLLLSGLVLDGFRPVVKAQLEPVYVNGTLISGGKTHRVQRGLCNPGIGREWPCVGCVSSPCTIPRMQFRIACQCDAQPFKHLNAPD